MKQNEAVFKMQLNGGDMNGSTLHTFIPEYMRSNQYELINKLGFDYKKFKKAGGSLFVMSLEIEFNYPAQFTKELVVKLSLLDIHDSRISILSKIRNPNGGLVATAISTYIIPHTKPAYKKLSLIDYFKVVETDLEEYATL